MKEKEFDEIVGSLGATEKSFIQERYYNEIKSWAVLIDQIYGYADKFDNFSDNFKAEITNNVTAFDSLLTQIKTLNITEDPSGPEHVKSRYTSFKNGELTQLLQKKILLESYSLNVADIESLKKIISNAKTEASNFEKSFSESLKKQAEGSQRTLAKHFSARLQELKKGNLTNPEKWLDKRKFWGWTLVAASLAMIVMYIIMIHYNWINGYEIQIALIKLVIISFVYAQYHFATKNYYVSSDLMHKYEHLTVISKTMTDFIAATFEDDVLKENVLSNASKTLFSELQTSYTKQDSKETSVFENIINQLPNNK